MLCNIKYIKIVFLRSNKTSPIIDMFLFCLKDKNIYIVIYEVDRTF